MKVRERASAVLVGVERDTLRGKVMGEKGEEKYLLKTYSITFKDWQ